MKNIFLFTGEESFNLMQELAKRKKAFGEKYGKENIFEFKSDEMDVGEFMNVVLGGGLFVSKKFVIVWGIPKDTNINNKISESKYKVMEEKLLGFLGRISEDVILVFASFSPDKRLKLYKYFAEKLQPNNIKTFEKLKDSEIKSFVLKASNNAITSEAADLLFEFVGNDLFSLNNEIQKLNVYAQDKGIKITPDLIQKFVYKKSNIDAFGVLDKIVFDTNKTIEIINENQKSGQDEFEFLGLLYWGLKILIQMSDLAKSGVKDSKLLASRLGVHPFVVAKNMKMIDKIMIKENKLKDMFEKLINLDFFIKTGRIPAEMFWLEIKTIVLG